MVDQEPLPAADHNGNARLRHWLALPDSADAAQVASASEALDTWLDSAPAELQGWADQQRAAHADAATDPSPVTGTEPLDPALAELAPALERTGDEAVVATAVYDAEGNLRADAPASTPLATAAPRRTWPGWFMPLMIALAAALVVIVVYKMGDPPPAENPPVSMGSTQGPAPTLDQAAIDQLITKFRENPTDLATLKELGERYFAVEQFDKAAEWQSKVVELTPQDEEARLGYGMSLFNSGDIKGAETQWTTVVQLNPKNVRAHYNLGFLYLSKEPAETEKARQAWDTVIKLDPDSRMAQTILSHRDGLAGQMTNTPSPTTSPATSPAGPATASSPASPAPTPSPTTTP